MDKHRDKPIGACQGCGGAYTQGPDGKIDVRHGHDCKRVEIVGWVILQALHKDVPEADRPLSWSDLNAEQEGRIRAAAEGVLIELDNTPMVSLPSEDALRAERDAHAATKAERDEVAALLVSSSRTLTEACAIEREAHAATKALGSGWRDAHAEESARANAAEAKLRDARFVLQRIANCTTGDVQAMADDALAGRLPGGSFPDNEHT